MYVAQDQSSGDHIILVMDFGNYQQTLEAHINVSMFEHHVVSSEITDQRWRPAVPAVMVAWDACW